MLNDLRYALRTLRRSPGFAIAAILSIGLAIGANASLFSMADAMILRPLPVPQSSGIFTVATFEPVGRLAPYGNLSYPEYLDFRDANRSFERIAAYTGVTVGFAKDVTSQAQLKMGLAVTGNFFDMLGVRPQLGRTFTATEGVISGRDPIVVLSHDLWTNELGRDPQAVGRHVRLNGSDFEVIGVMSESFTGMNLFVRPSFYVPISMQPALEPSIDQPTLTNRQRRSYEVKGRLKRGVSLSAARAEAATIFATLEKSHHDTNRGVGGDVRTELQDRTDNEPLTPTLMALLGVLVAIVLAIACGNVANLTLSRARVRAREAALRLAMGAGRWRLARQFLAESLIIAVAGGALGVVIAAYAVRAFHIVDAPGDFPVEPIYEVNQRVLWFTFLVAAASAILCGLMPALQSARTDLVSVIKSADSLRRRERLIARAALVSIQIAGSLVLLIAGIQLARGFDAALAADRGYRTDHRLTVRMDPGLAGYDAPRTAQFYRTLVERTRETNGVRSAALSSWIPMADGWRSLRVAPDGFQLPPGQESATAFYNVVDDSYFATLGVPLLKGRAFLSSDRADSPLVAVVNNAFARKYLGEQPLGKRLRLVTLGDRTVEVVGVTPTGKNISALEPPIDFVYLPFSQHPEARMTLTVETASDPAAAAGPIREVIRSIGVDVPVFAVRTLQDVYEQRSVKVANLILTIVGFVGALGLSLAVIGLYALVAYQVARRTREIGIRIAVGAAQSDVIGMVLKQALAMGVIGVAIGLAGGVAIAPSLAIVGNRPPYDSVLFTAAPAALLFTALVATAIPARRAARIDPQKALRQE